MFLRKRSTRPWQLQTWLRKLRYTCQCKLVRMTGELNYVTARSKDSWKSISTNLGERAYDHRNLLATPEVLESTDWVSRGRLRPFFMRNRVLEDAGSQKTRVQSLYGCHDEFNPQTSRFNLKTGHSTQLRFSSRILMRFPHQTIYRVQLWFLQFIFKQLIDIVSDLFLKRK